MQPIRRALPVVLATYVYRETGLPNPGDERERPNLWIHGGSAPSGPQRVEIVVESFVFAP